MSQLDLFGDKNLIQVPSMTDGNKFYQIDVKAKTCTCPSFKKSKQKQKVCKHLLEHGVIKKKEIKYPVYPAYSQAMSAMIKAARLRYTDKAIYWLLHLWELKESRYRVLRRIWVLAAEDNTSIPVMEKCSFWYRNAMRDMDNASLLDAVVEVMRICGTDNWWKDERAERYILAWKRGEKIFTGESLKGIPFQSALDGLKAEIENKNPDRAIAYLCAVNSSEGFNVYQLGYTLIALAEKQGNLE